MPARTITVTDSVALAETPRVYTGLPEDFGRVLVRGTFLDLGGNPLSGSVEFRASPRVVVDTAHRKIIGNRYPFSSALDEWGYFETWLPATDDPDITPSAWTYAVTEPTGRIYDIVVPVDTPPITDSADPHFGERVIDLSSVVPTSASPGTALLLRGVGISSLAVESGNLVAYYTDGTSGIAGPVGGAHHGSHGTGGSDPLAPADIGAAASTDARLSDARTPTAHKSTHATGGSDAITPADIHAVADTDSRLTNARTPTAHKTSHATGGTDALSPADIGAAASTDARLSDARTPLSHAASHATGSTDPITPSSIGAVGKGALIFNAKDYGAVGNGSTNDTSALQSAINAAATAGARLYLPAGVYLVTPGATSAGLVLKAGLRALTGDAGSTVIKVINSAPAYHSVLGTYDGSTHADVGGLVISDLRIDQNNTNNQWTNAAAEYATGKPRFCVYITNNSKPITIQRCQFVDLDNTNTIAISGAWVTDHTIQGCLFEWGSCPVDHDSSVIYTTPQARRNAAVWIIDNTFRSPGAGSKAATTAIETHGGAQVVKGNVITAFSAGMNITGIGLYGAEGAVVESNIITEAKFGIELWSQTYSTNTTVGLRNATIRSNIIKLNGPGWGPLHGGNGYAVGILRDNNATTGLPFEDITIDGNQIIFNNTGYAGQFGDDGGNGVEWRQSALTITDKRILIRNNFIDSPLACGVRFSVIGQDCEISGNTIHNPGQGRAGTGVLNSGYCNGIAINGAIVRTAINNNYIIDDQGTATTAIGVYINPTAAGSSANRALGNRVPVATSKKIDTNTLTNSANVLIRQDMDTYSAITGKALRGSEVVDLANGLRYVQTASGEANTWTSQSLIVATPSASFGYRPVSNLYFGPSGTSRVALTMVANVEYAIPVWIATSATLTLLGIEITTGVAGSLVRLGVRADSGTSTPGTLLLDAGTVAGDTASTSGISTTISLAVTPGLYWFTATAQNGTPGVRAEAGGDLAPVSHGSLAGALGTNPLTGYYSTSTTGALPASYTLANYVGSAPRVVAKA